MQRHLYILLVDLSTFLSSWSQGPARSSQSFLCYLPLARHILLPSWLHPVLDKAFPISFYFNILHHHTCPRGSYARLSVFLQLVEVQDLRDFLISPGFSDREWCLELQLQVGNEGYDAQG